MVDRVTGAQVGTGPDSGSLVTMAYVSPDHASRGTQLAFGVAELPCYRRPQ